MRTQTRSFTLLFFTWCLSATLPVCLKAADISPSNGPTVGGTAITITVDFPEMFGSSQGSGTVTLGGVLCTIQSWGNSSIVFLSPAGFGVNKTVNVTTNGGSQIESDNDFDYNAPTIISFSPNNSPTMGGGTCTITGTNFGPTGTTATVSFNGNLATSVMVLSHTSISCVVPPGAGLSVDVDVTVGTQTNATNPAYSYNGPTISLVNPNNSDTPGGGTATITGTNFGPIGTTASVLIGMGTPATATITVAHTTMVFTVPPGLGTNLTIHATVANQNSNNLFFSYNPPSITSLSPSQGSTAGNYSAMITGTNFGPGGTPVTLLFDGIVIPSALVVNHTLITFTVPAGSGADIPVSVVINGSSPAITAFDYAPPQILGMIPNTGEPAGGYSATITGINFGPIAEPMSILINGVPATGVVKSGLTTASFIVPAGQGVNLPVTAIVDNQSSNDQMTFSYVTTGANATDVKVLGDAVVSGDLRLGNLNSPPVAGTIRWNGSDFIGWTGSQWVSFTNDAAIYDYEGNEYSSVTINSTTWLNENLRVTTFNDGTPIPVLTSNTDWSGLISPGMGWYNNDQATNEFSYGALYNWYTVSTLANGGKNVCPVGWHVPDLGEWNTLIAATGGSTASTTLKEAGTVHWDPPNTANNATGYTAVGAGQRTEAGLYSELKIKNYLWSTNSVNTTNATVYAMTNNTTSVPSSSVSKKIGASIRCKKD